MAQRIKQFVFLGLGFALLSAPAFGQVITTTRTDDQPAPAGDVDRVVKGGQVAGGGFRAPEGVKIVKPGALVFASFDANHDGRISAQELEAGAAAAFEAADKNKDGVISGFEQNEWAASVGGMGDVLSNPMTFDGNLDRSITKAEFTAGLKRIAATLTTPPGGELAYSDLIKPLSNNPEDKGGSGGNSENAGLGTIQPRVGKSGSAPVDPKDPSTPG